MMNILGCTRKTKRNRRKIRTFIRAKLQRKLKERLSIVKNLATRKGGVL